MKENNDLEFSIDCDKIIKIEILKIKDIQEKRQLSLDEIRGLECLIKIKKTLSKDINNKNTEW